MTVSIFISCIVFIFFYWSLDTCLYIDWSDFTNYTQLNFGSMNLSVLNGNDCRGVTKKLIVWDRCRSLRDQMSFDQGLTKIFGWNWPQWLITRTKVQWKLKSTLPPKNKKKQQNPSKLIHMLCFKMCIQSWLYEISSLWSFCHVTDVCTK